MKDDSFYTIKSIEKVVNWIIKAVFYYRIGLVLLALAFIGYLEYRYWNNLGNTDKVKNFVAILTGGSIVIGIFYSILNYEYSQIRFKHDSKTSRDVLSFNVANEWHKVNMVEAQKVAKKFLRKCQPLLLDNNAKKFHDELEDERNENRKAALISIFNYFESLSLGVKQGIIDEQFIRGFFGSIFESYYNEYIFYIEYRRRVKKNAKIWIHFTQLAQKWINC